MFVIDLCTRKTNACSQWVWSSYLNVQADSLSDAILLTKQLTERTAQPKTGDVVFVWEKKHENESLPAFDQRFMIAHFDRERWLFG